MSATRQIIGGIAVAVGLAVADEIFVTEPITSIITLGLALAFLIVGLIKGQRMSVFLRALISVLILYWGYSACLAGRTMEVGLTYTTVSMAIGLFFICGGLPGLALLRLWPNPKGAAFLCTLLPASFLLACFVASAEEYLFVQKHKDTGIGPTARWTVPHHWLAYDKEHKRLDGSD